MRKKAVFLFILIGLFLSNYVFPEESEARAYIVDGTNGTRSGPVRAASYKDQLESDRKFLVKHAQSNERSSGVATPGDKYWTDLPKDSIFESEKTNLRTRK